MRHRARRGKGNRFAVLQPKHRAVSPTFDLGGFTVHFAFGQAEVLVTASVVQHVDVVLDADDHQYPVRDVNLSRHAAFVLTEQSDVGGVHGVTTLTAASTEVTSRSTSSARAGGRFASIS